jgi:hypothetical protein
MGVQLEKKSLQVNPAAYSDEKTAKLSGLDISRNT